MKSKISQSNLNDLKNRLPGPAILPGTAKYGILIPLIEGAYGYELLFQERSHKLSKQPGDICFPGGRLEEGESPVDTAVREACEELLITPSMIDIRFPADIYVQGDTLVLYPFAAVLNDYKGTYSSSEVERAFTVPLDFFMKNEPDEYRARVKTEPLEDFPYELINGGREYKWRDTFRKIYFYEYEGTVIWGMTARMIYNLVEILKKNQDIAIN